MNSLERVVGTLMGKPVDRRPFIMNLSLYGAKLSGRSVVDHYSDPDTFIEGMVAVREMFESDVVSSPFAFAIEGEAFGSRIEVRGNQAPILVEPAILNPKSISRITPPDVDRHPRILYLRNTIRGLADRYQGEVPVCGLLHNPFSLPIMIMGIENWLQTLLFEDRLRDEMLEISKTHFLAMSNAFISDGAQFLMIPALCVNPAVLTRHLVEQLVLPVYREVFAEIPVPIFVHHSGKQMLKFLDLLAEIPQIAGIVLAQEDDPTEARRLVGPEKILLSGIDAISIERSSMEEITIVCEQLAEPCRNDPRFIPMTTYADIPYAAPIENVNAARRVMAGCCEELLSAT